MKNKKFVVCSGLAFADKEDMQMLHEYALDGWVFRRLRFGCVYELHKEEPKSLVFSYDIQNIKKADKEDYLTFFEEGGWSLIPKWNQGVRFFYAQEGTKELHTESETRNEQYKPTFFTGIVILILSMLCILIGVKWNIVFCFILAGGGIGGGVMITIGCLMRMNGKRVACNPRSYPYQIAKLVLGCIFLGLFLKTWTRFLNGYNLFVLLVALWFIIGSIHGCYKCHEERKRKEEKKL